MAIPRHCVRSFVRSVAVLSLAMAPACRVPRHVHEPREYPDLKLDCSAVAVEVVDLRRPGVNPNERRLILPTEFEADAQRRLSRFAGGSGPVLKVKVDVLVADELELVDSRGEVTRVAVTLAQEVSVQEGPVLGRSEEHSRSDIPRAEATPEEIDFVLRATLSDAFDRKWSEPATLERLQRRLAAYARKDDREPGAAADEP